jgi:transcriptional regulator with XRE-family HTH domain
MDNFGEWLAGQLQAKGWRQADLARASGLDSAVISNLVNGRRNPGVNSCVAIARALSLPNEEVLEAAGLLPKEKGMSVADRATQKLIKKAMTMLEELPPEEQERIIDNIEIALERHQRRRERPASG